MPGVRSGGAIETIDGFHVARWSDAKLSCVAVSVLDEKDLAAYAEAFRAAQKPIAEGTGR
jgi:anti-sigma factor RsiW